MYHKEKKTIIKYLFILMQINKTENLWLETKSLQKTNHGKALLNGKNLPTILVTLSLFSISRFIHKVGSAIIFGARVAAFLD